MQYLQNDTAANIIADTVMSLVSKRLNDGKRLINVLSGGHNNNTHCYYSIDKDQEHIVNTNKEIRENTNLYDIEILMIHLEYMIIEEKYYEVYDHDAKVLEVRSLVTDSATASTCFLDRLWNDKDAKSIKKVYVHNNEIFNTIEELILHLVKQKEDNLLFNEV